MNASEAKRMLDYRENNSALIWIPGLRGKAAKEKEQAVGLLQTNFLSRNTHLITNKVCSHRFSWFVDHQAPSFPDCSLDPPHS